MKKFFTLVASALLAVGAFAQEMEVDLPIESASQWSSGWASTVEFANGVITATNGSGNNDYGAAAIWLGDVDWSEYASVTVVLESCSSGWGQIVVNGVGSQSLTSSFGQTSTQRSVSCDLSTLTENVKQLCIQSSPNSVYSFSRVYLTKKVEFDAPKVLEVDQYGNCYSAQFNGLSDYAKIVFTYETTGELVNDEGKDVTGWGTGAIQSCNGTKVTDIPAKSIGTNTMTFTLSELKNALNDGPSQYGTYGINYYFYPQGHSESKFVKIEAYQEKGFTGVGYQAPSPTEAITINANGVASHVAESALDFQYVTDYMHAYVATGMTTSEIILTEVLKVPAGTAFVVKGAPGETYDIQKSASSNITDLNGSEVSNLFMPSDGSYTVSSSDQIYALAIDGVFKKVASGVTIPAGKAYIDALVGAKPTLTLNFGDATAINAVETVDAENGVAYNVAGQRVNSNAKGIVIMNGKKYINK